MVVITMKKEEKVLTFTVYNDCNYAVKIGNIWSTIKEDFADVYIKLREIGYIEM